MIETRQGFIENPCSNAAPLTGYMPKLVRKFSYVASNENNITKEQLRYKKQDVSLRDGRGNRLAPPALPSSLSFPKSSLPARAWLILSWLSKPVFEQRTLLLRCYVSVRRPFRFSVPRQYIGKLLVCLVKEENLTGPSPLGWVGRHPFGHIWLR